MKAWYVLAVTFGLFTAVMVLATVVANREVTDRLDRIERILLLEVKRRRVHRRIQRRYLR